MLLLSKSRKRKREPVRAPVHKKSLEVVQKQGCQKRASAIGALRITGCGIGLNIPPKPRQTTR